MSEEHDYNSEEEFEEIEDMDISEVLQRKAKLKPKKDPSEFELANGNLHFLPNKIFYTGNCRVNVFFDPLIEAKNGGGNGDYKTSFRGRIFNGKKVIADENFLISHVKMDKKQTYSTNNKKCKVAKVRKINDYFIWKFDEEVPYNNNLLKMGSIMKNLDVLK